jgi:heme oxygenase (biliverdin-IX-beta and delta-forming)
MKARAAVHGLCVGLIRLMVAFHHKRHGMAFDELKQGTLDLHRRVEQVVNIESRCTCLHSYLALLSRLLGYYEPLEHSLSAFDWQAADLDFAARRKSAWLRDDLAVLGIKPAHQTALPRCAALPRLTSMAAALGAMYVLEGATLGGQVILRMVDKNLQLSAPRGAGFHAGYGSQNGSMWLSFKAAATRQLDTTARIAEAVHTARETFTTYETWLHSAVQGEHQTSQKEQHA